MKLTHGGNYFDGEPGYYEDKGKTGEKEK